MLKITAAALMLFVVPAIAAEPTLNDLPMILKQLRGCTETHGVFSSSIECRVDEKDLWIAIDSSGRLSLFRQRSYGDVTYAYGRTVAELLRNFAARLNEDQQANAATLRALAPYLPTQ